ncbi:hypothetical protein CFSAN000603_14835 [Salmonella enterica subsp. enterica serovar Paratyphi C str. CFSAN000603]|uniref:Uncharacterized protein n=3 Tax=Salmonella enterica TaxID=28901 RepID=A0A753Z8G2_SALER|nr:hypothetical protein [Salmonella enterica]ECK9403495.1 hypothetical protein [Salmonella enterica subsp. enterica serovar Paratyphi C str. CFSAN000603]QUZ43902.1 hypothetical protein JYM88_12000 [Salmonella enterica subsp. enterica serovar Paratyphi B str. CFSAN000549]HAB6612430.1 hypothetical protein [Salmonella enterica subsp. enterica serovar Paratyphi C]HAE8363011.1 hypothetical protein [Salmonella enterica subsp. enterica serovar Paratyphi B]ESF86652.1 hypothetical protein SEEPB585_0412
MTTVKELIKSVNCDLNVLGDVKATQWRKDHNMNYAKARHNKDHIAISCSTDARKTEALKLIPLVNDKKLKWSDIDKEIEAIGGSLALQSWYTFTGLSAKKRESKTTPIKGNITETVSQDNNQLKAMQLQLEELKARLEVAEAISQLVPVIVNKDSQSSVLAKIKAEEQAKELADIQRYTEERKKQTEEAITKQMCLVFPNYSPDIITSIVEETTKEARYTIDYDVKGLTKSEIDHCISKQFDQDKIDEYRLDIWQSKVEIIADATMRAKIKSDIGDDYHKDWEMIKKFLKEYKLLK